MRKSTKGLMIRAAICAASAVIVIAIDAARQHREQELGPETVITDEYDSTDHSEFVVKWGKPRWNG